MAPSAWVKHRETQFYSSMMMFLLSVTVRTVRTRGNCDISVSSVSLANIHNCKGSFRCGILLLRLVRVAACCFAKTSVNHRSLCNDFLNDRVSQSIKESSLFRYFVGIALALKMCLRLLINIQQYSARFREAIQKVREFTLQHVQFWKLGNIPKTFVTN